ncbi:MAG: helix-hairpin-helix domain-containing protein, partial [Allobranchiibius sp.]
MRKTASILHLDLDAFFAAVEQRDKPSLLGKPVCVGGTGYRGVIATASYEARAYGARSAMPTAQARRLCPSGTAFLSPRFAAYSRSSEAVMALLRELSPRIQQVSVDEAYVDLAEAGIDLTVDAVTKRARELLADIPKVTGGLTASVGIGSSKMLAKIASDLDKPVGLVVVPPGTELELLAPLSVRAIGGIGPATATRLRTFGVESVADLQRMGEPDLISVFGDSHGRGIYRLARAQDD